MLLDRGAYVFSPYAIPTAVTTALMLLFGVTVFLRRASRVSAAFLSLTAFASIWLFAFTFMYSATDAGHALFWARIAYFGVPFLAPAIYQFTVEMLRIMRLRRIAVIIGWVLGAMFSATALLSDALVTGVTHYWWGFYPRYSVALSIPFLAYFFGYLIAALVEFVLHFPQSRGVERTRIRLLIVSFGIAYLGCVDYLPKYGLAVYPFGYIPLLLFALVVARIVWKYELVPIMPSLASREILSTIADALFVCDREGSIQFANEAVRRLLGYEPADLIGVPIDHILVLRNDDGSLVRRKTMRSEERVFLAADGQKIDMNLTIAPVTNGGEAAGAVVIGRDVRERKRAESEVRRVLTLLQSTLESTADGILVVGDRNRILTYNQRFCDMWRIPAELMATEKNRKLLEYVLDQLEHPEEFVRIVDSLYAQPQAESYDLIEFKDGRRFERYSIGRDVEGTDVRVWSFRDITSRFQSEQLLRDSELRYRLLFEQNAAGVCVTTVGGQVLDCNITFATMLGYARPELIGMSMGDLYVRHSERHELVSLLRDCRALNSVEVELHRRDGSSAWVLKNLMLVGDGAEAKIHTTLVDISDRKRAEEQIEFHAYHDVLTGLPNRKLFTDRLGQSLNRSRRSNRAVAVMFVDLDHFKTINDTLGHTAGDELLLEMSRRLKECIRDDDTVARIGGDEFTIILSDLRQPEDAAAVAQKILETVQIPLSISGMPIEVTASVGIALFPVDGGDPESLLRNADSAMYRAKESGRNNFQLCTDDMKRRANERLSLETRLRKAIHEEHLMLLYQPQISLITGRVIGAEALVRWKDNGNIIEPSAFIPLAEESRLILPLGEWVLRNACKQAKEWQDLGIAPIRTAVNLSARQFQQHDLVQMVSRVLEETRADPSALELEITETTAMSNGEVTVEVLRALRALGVSISIDDFGTGYSSLGYLKRFPINAVKIDRAFVRDITNDENDAAIVSAVIGIARSMRLRVVAEGVESEDQFHFLQRRHCDEAQGFYFSHPIEAGILTEALAAVPLAPLAGRAAGVRGEA
jgi:diguanylate cyclase (GGDEF)-like protein/PAS domain S-box-containing protein